MEPTSLFVGLLVIFSLFIYCYIFSSKPNYKANAPPEAGGAWPFVGHLHLISGGSPTKLPHVTLGAMADKYGPIFTIRLGVNRALVVSSGGSAKELFTTGDVAVASRPKLAAPTHLGYDMAMFGFSPYGPYWREVRKLISTELLSARRLELQKHVLVSEISQSINELYKLWSEKAGSSGRVAVEMKEWLGDLNLNVVLRMVVGKRCFGSSGGGEEARRCQRVMRDFFHLAGVFTVGDALPYLRWLDIGGYERKMKQTSRELDLLVGQWLEEHREMKEVSEKQQDFMDVMLSVVQGRRQLQGEYDSDTIIKSTCSVSSNFNCLFISFYIYVFFR